MDSDLRQRDRNIAKRKRLLADSEKRITELDAIFKRLYEDNISGKLSDERFQKLSADYEKEGQELKVLTSPLRKEVEQGYRSLVNVKSHGINGKMRKRYSRSYTVLSFLSMFSYRELPCRSFRFTLCFRSAPTDANPNFDRVCKHCECAHSCGFHQPNTKSRHFA